MIVSSKASPWAAGTTLYMPATEWKFMENVIAGKFPFLPSVTLCLEDAIRKEDVPQGIACIKRFVADIAGHGPEAKPLIFIRARDIPNLETLVSLKLHGITGFVLPKFRLADFDLWERALSNTPYLAMPTLETAEVLDMNAMRCLRDRLLSSQFRRRVLLLRIGGNDLQQILGIARLPGHTIYDGALGYALSMLCCIFKPAGFSLSAPVFNSTGDYTVFNEEIRRDIMHGFCGKTAIHPLQLPVIREAYSVTDEEENLARTILDAEKAVFRHENIMCEPCVQSRWAKKVLERKAAFQTSRPKASSKCESMTNA